MRLCLGQHVLEINRKLVQNIAVKVMGTHMSDDDATVAFNP